MPSLRTVSDICGYGTMRCIISDHRLVYSEWGDSVDSRPTDVALKLTTYLLFSRNNPGSSRAPRSGIAYVELLYLRSRRWVCKPLLLQML